MIDDIKNLSQKYQPECAQFLCDLIATPSMSSQEENVINVIRKKMEQFRYDEVTVDPMGNLLGRIGNGKTVIALDAHVDTVDVGNASLWKTDPFKGVIKEGVIYGRGASDMKGSVASIVFAGRIAKELGPAKDFTLYVVCSVQEEDCDGLCWQYIVKEDKIRPDAVVITDSTDCNILRGHRGRMEIGVTTHGRSCHGSMPDQGENAVYKIAAIVREIEQLHKRLKSDPFLGKGTVTVSHIECKSPSLCAVPGQAYIHLDRRLTTGDTKQSAVAEVKDAIKRAGVTADVEVLTYSVPSYTGMVYPTEKYFPTWCEDEDALQVQAAIKAHHDILGATPTVHRWTFSTNGVSIAGLHGIPCVGFGPAPESVAHTVDDSVPIRHLVKCAAFYAGYPQAYCDLAAGRPNKTKMTVKHKKG